MNKILLKTSRFSLLNVTFSKNLSSATCLNDFKNHLRAQLDSIKSAGTFKNERIIISKQSSHIKVAGRKGDILNFCANNYLGLSV